MNFSMSAKLYMETTNETGDETVSLSLDPGEPVNKPMNPGPRGDIVTKYCINAFKLSCPINGKMHRYVC